MEVSFELASLRKRIQELESENTNLKKVLKDNDLEQELEAFTTPLLDEEFICVNEISKLKILSEKGLFTENEAKILDILYKNLRAIRGQTPTEKSKSKKKPDIAELFRIVQNTESK